MTQLAIGSTESVLNAQNPSKTEGTAQARANRSAFAEVGAGLKPLGDGRGH